MEFNVMSNPYPLAVVFIGVALYACRRIWKSRVIKGSVKPLIPTQKAEPVYSEDAYYDIQPLHNFDLAKEDQIKIRIFKPKYHLTMAIENITLSDLIVMDNTYHEKVALRKNLIREREGDVLAINPHAEPAVLELYDWLVKTYLPTHFPTVYTSSEKGLHNQATGDIIPLRPSSGAEALRILGGNVDTDLLFLLPIQEPGEDQGKYRLEAFVTCFPSGFSTRSKLNLKLADIHTPVPSYAQRLEKSMDRFFASLPISKIVRRYNWSITTDNALFNLAGNHGHEHDGRDDEFVDLKTTVLRCERQTVHRLPRTGAILFAFKTYLYPIQELRDEGSGEDLALAIDGLGAGNAPGMTVYKRQVVWGEKVKKFLRGEIGVDA